MTWRFKFVLIKLLFYSLLFALGATVFAVTSACDEQNSARENEQQTQTRNYESITQQQPAKTIDYSSTRDTANKWIERWGQEGQISFVYITDSGEPTGYYVLDGLPVSYNARLTPPENYIDIPGDNTSVYKLVQAPAMDGAYYTGSGSATQFYGFDARTDAYYEWSVGGSQNYFLSDRPLQQYRNVPAIGDTSIDDVETQR